MNNIYDIYINGVYFGNVNARDALTAGANARLLINQSNPSVNASKFSLVQRVSPIEFDL